MPHSNLLCNLLCSYVLLVIHQEISNIQQFIINITNYGFLFRKKPLYLLFLLSMKQAYHFLQRVNELPMFLQYAFLWTYCFTRYKGPTAHVRPVYPFERALHQDSPGVFVVTHLVAINFCLTNTRNLVNILYELNSMI